MTTGERTVTRGLEAEESTLILPFQVQLPARVQNASSLDHYVSFREC